MNQHCPLLFNFRDTIYGSDFAAEVSTRGRVLGAREGESVWMYGVLPGGLAAEGKDPAEAYANFRRAFLGVLFDIAEGTSSFEEFRANVQSFFDVGTEETEREWWAAVNLVRAGHVDAPDIPRRPADEERGVEVTLIEQFGSSKKFALAGSFA